MNSQKTALALTEKGGCVIKAIWAAWRVGWGSHNERAVHLQFLCVCLSRLSSHQGTGHGGGQDHSHHYQRNLLRNRKCCRDAQNILRKRPGQLNQNSEGSLGFHVPWVKVVELVVEVAVEVVRSGHPN